MYTWIYFDMSTEADYKWTRIYTHFLSTSTSIYTYIYIFVHIYIFIYTYVFICAYIYNKRTDDFFCICRKLAENSHAYIYLYICTYAYQHMFACVRKTCDVTHSQRYVTYVDESHINICLHVLHVLACKTLIYILYI